MQHKKWLFILLLLVVLSFNKTVYADDQKCYYQGENTQLWYNPVTTDVTIDIRDGQSNNVYKTEPLKNRKKNKTDKETDITVTAITSGCPKYIVFRQKVRNGWFDSDEVWGFNDASAANKFATASSQVENMKVWTTDKDNEDGSQRTREEYAARTREYYDGGSTAPRSRSTEVEGVTISDKKLECKDLFDSDIKELVKEVLKYPRIIVPILVVVLGSIDFFKAVIASKEDDMKKAQKTFIKRFIIAILIFFIPTFIEVIMWFANIAWEGLGYTSCSI